jgi:hypothetical protein
MSVLPASEVKHRPLEPDIWQEYDCPSSQSDYDLADAEICAVGERFFCPLCSGHHTAGLDGPDQTVLRLVPDGPMIFRGLPKDAEEKASWIAEVVNARIKLAQQPIA